MGKGRRNWGRRIWKKNKGRRRKGWGRKGRKIRKEDNEICREVSDNEVDR